jgi:RNA polymerase sigma factor (sigma-70 family)
MLLKTLEKIFPTEERHRYLRTMAKCLLRRGDGYPAIAVDDLIQEGHLRIIKAYKRCQYHPKKIRRARNFLILSAKGAMVDAIRAATRWRLRQRWCLEELEFHDVDCYLGDRSRKHTETNLFYEPDLTEGLQADFMLSEMNHEDREIIKERAVDGFFFHQVGARRGYTESRACQVYYEAIDRAREKLADTLG